MYVNLSQFVYARKHVGNSADKNVSIVSKEWLLYLNDNNLIPEQSIFLKEAVEGKEVKHTFTVDALNKKKKTVKEFNGCPERHPENKLKYDKLKYVKEKGITRKRRI